MVRTQLYADPAGRFVHDVILEACRRFGEKTAIIDTSLPGLRGQSGGHIRYAEYGAMIERLARGFVQAGVKPGEVIGIYLPNSWEFCAAYHAATLAGAIPTPLNPSYREREVRYQLEASGAVALITDGAQIKGMDVKGLPALRRIYTTRETAKGADPFATLLRPGAAAIPKPSQPSKETLAALPFSSGTTGLPKGVMLSHFNLVANIFQFLPPDEAATLTTDDVVLCFLPLYHIYGLNVVLNPTLTIGATLVLMPRFDAERAAQLVAAEAITWMPCVPPVLNAFCHVAEQGKFPTEHHVRCVKSGAAPLAPDLARRFVELTGIPIRQGYGMTEASPVTHMGYLEPERYKPDSIGWPLAQTDCRLIGENDAEVKQGESGELVMRGPQFMLGYWRAPEATAAVLRDGWFWSGDVARMDADGAFYIVDRRKEMIKYKGFPVAPAEVESVLLEHPAVRDCGVVGRADEAAGEIPCAFVVLRDDVPNPGGKIESEISGFVAERLTSYKTPREFRFVDAIPRNPSGKILRRELRKLL